MTTNEGAQTGHSHVVPRLRHPEFSAEVKGAGNILCYQRVPYGTGWALVGDAHQILDPRSGMGIDHATTHASILTDSLHRFLTDAAARETAMSDYTPKPASGARRLIAAPTPLTCVPCPARRCRIEGYQARHRSPEQFKTHLIDTGFTDISVHTGELGTYALGRA